MTILLLCIFLHFIADFVLQSREMGKKKSTEWKWLLKHLLIQFLAFTPIGLKFAFLNALIHGVIDKNIWTFYKYTVYWRDNTVKPETWKYWDDHWFYLTIGFDQMLHFATIIILLGVLK